MIGTTMKVLAEPFLFFLLLPGLMAGKQKKKSHFRSSAAPHISCTYPFGTWTRPTNAFSLAEYSSHRESCTAFCNAANFCCTKDAGVNNVAPCTTGCHIAWSSSSVEECKAECDLANKKSDCDYEFNWDYAHVAKEGFGLSGDMKLQMCVSGETCGCPTDKNTGAADRSEQACKRGCEFANEASIRANFYHGKSVIIDPHIDLSLSTLMSALSGIKGHVEGSTTLSKAQLNANLARFLDNAEFLEKDFDAMNTAFEVIDSYEEAFGPLFLSPQTTDGFDRENENDGLALERIILAIQQGLLDEIFQGSLTVAESQSDSIIKNCAAYLNGRAWQTSNFFPGWVDPPQDQTKEYTTMIDASVPTFWGKKVCFADKPALRPTGLYLTPGGVASVKVPGSLVNKGFKISVGAAEADHSTKGRHLRMDRVVATYTITSTTTYVANPLGGGIYISVPYETYEGIQEVSISGSVVEAPLFSMTNFKTTSRAEWDRLRTSPAPWADFVTESFFMQVPTSWTLKYDYDHFFELLEGRNEAMAAASRFVGIPIDKRNNYVSYVQPDIQIRHDAFGVGYPQVNVLVSSGEKGPVAPTSGVHDWLVASKFIDDTTFWHELGHCIVPRDYYEGETEAISNILKAFIDNTLSGVNFNTAFAESFTAGGTFTPDRAAMHWMVTPNFRNGRAMDTSNTELDEMRYQERGYAKYADIVRFLGGWETLIEFFRQNQLNFVNRKNKAAEDVDQEGLDKSDYRTLMLSKAVGFDISPLIHFWGVHPTNKDALRAKLKENGLFASTTVRDQLSRYASLVPKNNAEFQEYAMDLFPRIRELGWIEKTCESPLYGCGWFGEWMSKYGAAEGTQGVKAVKAIIDLYYPPSHSIESTLSTSPKKSHETHSAAKISSLSARVSSRKAPRFLFAGQDNMVGNFDPDVFNTTFRLLQPRVNDEVISFSLVKHLKQADSSPPTSQERYELVANELIRLKNKGLLPFSFPAPLSTVDCSFYQLDNAIDYSDGTTEPIVMATNEALGPNVGCGEPFGPELMFGHVMDDCYAEPISIIKVTGESTELQKHWSKSNGWFWGEVMERIQDLDTSKDQWKGIVWFQGETDAFAAELVAEEYESLIAIYIADLRLEMYAIDKTVFADPSKIPVVIVGVGCWIAGSGKVPNGPEILKAQTQFVEKDDNSLFVTTNDLSCNYQYDDASHIIIGYRIAEAMKTFQSISCGEMTTAFPTSTPVVEPLTKWPTSVPTDSPVEPMTDLPTPTPTMPREFFSDSPLAMFFQSRTCEWVSRRPALRCFTMGRKTHCPVSCGLANGNVDSTTRFYVPGVRRSKDCSWARRKRENRCARRGVKETCRKTCAVF